MSTATVADSRTSDMRREERLVPLPMLILFALQYGSSRELI